MVADIGKAGADEIKGGISSMGGRHFSWVNRMPIRTATRIGDFSQTPPALHWPEWQDPLPSMPADPGGPPPIHRGKGAEL
jgi:hypothetical protein